MGKITDPANKDYRFGLDFDYSVWTEGSQVDLVNVPWTNDYRDVVRFASTSARDAYINSLNPVGIRINKLSYLQPNNDVSIGLPFNRVNRYNYVRVTNPLQPVPGGDIVRNFYYFIQDVKYIAANKTLLTLQLDVWTTYNFDLQIGNSYVERGHISLANTKRMNNNGRDYLTVPEGLDMGSEYIVGWDKFTPIIEKLSSSTLPDYSIIVASTVDLEKDPGTVSNPKLVTANGGAFGQIVSGASFYGWDNMLYFAQWMDRMADKPWVTQGIISITLSPDLDKYFDDIPWKTDGFSPVNLSQTLNTMLKPKTISRAVQSNWRNSSMFDIWPDKYRKLDKFKTSPYMVIELTTYTATPVILRPEMWNDPDATVTEMVGLVPPSQKIVETPKGYNAYNTGTSYRDVGEFLDVATVISGLPQVLAVNNSAIAYMANNKNSIAFSYQNADWSQQRAMQGANAAAVNANRNAQTDFLNTHTNTTANMAQMANQNQLLANQNINNATQSVVGGAVSGLGGGAFAGPAGAAIGGVGGAANGIVNAVANSANNALQQGANSTATSITNSAMMENANRNYGTQGANIDTNYSLASMVAQGDYENAIAGIQAKLQDTKMLQPTTSGQMGGDAFNITYGYFGFALKWKWLDLAHMQQIGDFWLRYGYAINRFIKIPSSFMVMTKFTYWKLKETYITSAPIPELHKQAFRGIFEKGVTVWADPNDIGKIDLGDNDPLPGVSY